MTAESCSALPDEAVRWNAAERHLAWQVLQGGTVVVNVRKGELTGRALGCWCAPDRCHAQVLAELASAANTGRPGAG